MPRVTLPRLLPILGLALLGLHVGNDVWGSPGTAFGQVLADWFEPAAFLGCGLSVLLRALRSQEPAPWLLLGGGLTLYSAGNVYFNLAGAPGFPSAADVLWLLFYPCTFASLGVLLHRRYSSLKAAVWLDGAIGGGVVAALVAALVFDPVFSVTVGGGAASIARLAYPVGDLMAVGMVIAAWSVGGRRLEPFWGLLGAGFGLLALADSGYVVQAAHGTWAPGNYLDYPYAVATMLVAAAAWVREPRRDDSESVGVRLPVLCGLATLGLVGAEDVFGLNPLATALSLATMLAVVMRLGSTLARVNRQSRALVALAATDPLTGLPNHRTVHEQLARELKRARGIAAPLSVVALDIDHFKTLNDTYGHAEGDAALQAIARVLSEQVCGRQLVGRVGGEEFVLVLPETGPEDAFAVAEKCRGALARLSLHGAAGLSCSAGVASYPADDPDGTRLLELADGTLYWAKSAGRGQSRRYDPRNVVLLSSAEQRAQVQAVLDSPDALCAVFQPIVELATGRVAGYEALARFTGAQPARSPDLWFAQARRCGLGPALEARALAVALSVPDRPAGTFLSVNVSPGALVSSEVAAVLPEDLSELVIELTEDEVFSSDIAFDAALSSLRDRGARIAVDDAGAGYAGLQQVVRVAPEILKVDRSLIRGIDVDASKMALLEALTRFASTTGAAVCGEGIEKIDELRMLARADVSYAQGYALGRPGPPWPSVDSALVGQVAGAVSMGMRVSRGNGPLALGEIAMLLGRVRTAEDLEAGVSLIEQLLHGDEVAVSRVVPGERCVETLSEHGSVDQFERFSYDDYPTTEHVILDQVLGQVVADDPCADPAERTLLTDLGYEALLMVPIVARGVTIGLLEVSRRVARPWTSGEIDHAQLVAQSLAPAVLAFGSDSGAGAGSLPWTPGSFGVANEPAPRS